MQADDLTTPADDEPDQVPDDELVESLTSFDELLRSGEQSLSTVEGRFDLSDTSESGPVTARDCLILLEQVFPRGGDSPVPLSGQQIGRFELIRILGQGGFGTVYLARDPRLERLVALKVPRLHTLGNRTLHERFLREARAAAALDHPHIVPILETGEVGPVCYIASAYCEGADLEQWLKSHAPVAPHLAARIVETLADATQHSHTHGILHRDLKPSNILLTGRTAPEGASRDALPFTPRISDFGLARFTEEALGETGSGVVGTPLYMAPEQAAGQSDEVCPATDVYALGAILYELLTGRPPFQGTGFIEVLDQIRTSDPIPPARLVKSIPRDLETICLKCLEKKPSRRYAMANALYDDLCAFREGRAIAARSVGTFERAVKWGRRRPWAATLAFVVAAAVTSLITMQWRHSQTLTENLKTTDAMRIDAESREADLRLQFNASEINAAELDLSIGVNGDLERIASRMDSVRRAVPGGLPLPPGLEPEWNFVMRQLEPPPPERIFAGHQGPAFAVAIEPGRGLVASGDAKGQIKIWNLETGEEVASLAAHEGEVRALAFSPDGNRLASGAQFHQRFKVWDTANWGMVLAVEGHEMTITSIDWRPDGGQIASGSRDGKIHLWNAADLTLQQTLEVGPVVNRVKFSADGSTLYSSDKGNFVLKWGLNEHPPVRVELFQTERNPLVLEISSDGRFGIAGDTTFFDFSGRRLRASVKFLNRAAVIARTGNWAATGGGDGIIDLWRWAVDPLQGVSEQRWRGHGTVGIGAFAATPDGSRLITAGLDGLVKVWRVADFVHPTRQWLNGHSAGVNGLEFSHDDRLVASAGDDGKVCVYETRDGRLIDSLELGPQGGKVRNLQFEADGDTLYVAAGPPASGLVVWRPGSSTPHHFIPTPEINSLSLAPDGAHLAIAFAPQQGVVLWDTATQKPVRNLVDPPLDVAKVQFSPDGRWLALKRVGISANNIVLVDVETGVLREIRETDGPFRGFAFDREGQRLSIITGRQLLQLIDVTTAKVNDAFYLNVASLIVEDCCFSPDGEVVAFGLEGQEGLEGNVQVFHLGARQSALALEPYSFGAAHVTFSHDGRMLACSTRRSDKDGNAGIFIWRFDPPRAPR